MKKADENHRKGNRGSSGKPPRWLVLGTLAASAALGQLPVAAQAQDAEDSSRGDSPRKSQPPKRRDLLAGLLPASAADRDSGRRGASARRFDLPPGPLGDALEAFETATGLRVEMKQEAIRSLVTQGAQGFFTADQALRELLAGTAAVQLTGIYHNLLRQWAEV